MGSQVWIGTRGAEQWIKAPAPRTAFQAVGWSQTQQGRNGVLTGRNSRSTHMSYELSWPIIDTASARAVEDWFYGVAGDGLIHWIDPTIQNHLPARWSYPGLGCTDGRPLYGTQRPVAVATAANSKGLPARSATYTYDQFVPAADVEEAYIPIPPGYTLYVGVHGGTAAAASSIVTAQRYNGATAINSTPIVLPAIGPTDASYYTTAFTRTGSTTGVGIKINPGRTWGSGETAVTTPISGTIAAIMVKVVPTDTYTGGFMPPESGFIRGGGANGCKMFNPPTTAPISSYYDKTSISALLEEVGR